MLIYVFTHAVQVMKYLWLNAEDIDGKSCIAIFQIWLCSIVMPVFNCVHSMALAYLADDCEMTWNIGQSHLQSINQYQLIVPWMRHRCMAIKAAMFADLSVWHCEWETFVKHIASCWHSSLVAERSCTAVDMYLNIIIINMCCRYVDYICRMVSEEPTLPHYHQVMLSSLTMSPVPLVNRTRCVSIMGFSHWSSFVFAWSLFNTFNVSFCEYWIELMHGCSSLLSVSC